jgi:hypothetical protein
MRRPAITGRRVLLGLGLGAAAAGAATAAVLTVGSGDSERAARVPGAQAVEAHVGLSPRIVLFGDTVTARIDVLADRSRVDPGSVQVVQEFSPWSVLAEPVRTRDDADGVTHVVTSFVLRCVISSCVPPRDGGQLEFNPTRVSYQVQQEGKLVRRAVTVRWPVLVVHSRLVASDFDQREAIAAPWKADLLRMPAATYRVSPGTAFPLLIGAGAAFCLLGVALAVIGFPRRAPAPPEPEPEPEPEPVLPPLEQALVLLESGERTNGAADQRRALELVAEEMALRGDMQLERTARALAWSEEAPPLVETSGLAALVRAALEAEAEQAEPPEESGADPR